MPSTPPKGYIFYERFLDGETIKVRCYMRREGHEPVVCLIDVDRIPTTVSQEMIIYTDLKGLARL